MAFTTLTDLVAQAAALPVAGVKTRASYRPRQINAADLPLLFTRLPGSTRAISTLTYGQDLRHATLELVILVQMVNLDTQATNDALTVQLLDALAAALEANAAALGMDSYTLTPDEDSISAGASPVQAIVATLEVSG
jgi:hypothetical protein